MNYSKIYDLLIEKAKKRIIEGYKETHHIIPRCIGGTEDPSNLVDLTAREHFIAHLLLCEIYPKNRGIRLALWMMANVKDTNQKRHVPSSRLYEIIRREYSYSIKGGNNPRFGVKHLPETKEKMSIKAKERIGNKNAFHGKSHSDETKEKIKESVTGLKHTVETKQKMSETRKGKKSGRKGKTNSPEHNKKASESLKKMWERRKLLNNNK
jgi:hypothetical protein